MNEHPANALHHAINKIRADQDDLAEMMRANKRRAQEQMKTRYAGSFVESVDYDGDMGREHSEYMRDNGER